MDTSAVEATQRRRTASSRTGAWADQTQELLRWIGRGSVSGTRTQTSDSLGNFRTHLVMGLEALRYSEG